MGVTIYYTQTCLHTFDWISDILIMVYITGQRAGLVIDIDNSSSHKEMNND